MVIEEQEFNDKYWHSNTKLVTVINPRTDDYVFQAVSETGIDTSTGRMKAEQRTYKVPAGGNERFPGPIANIYLQQMTALVAQDEEKIQYLIDYALKAQYYDQLIVNVEDLINTYTPFPEYLEKPKETETAEQPKEEAFAGVKKSATETPKSK